MNRRLQSAAAAQGTDRIDSVTGPIAVDELGITLMHEHVLVDFIGASSVSPARYDAAEAFKTVLPHLQQLKQLGCGTLVECTPAYLGRDPRLLKRLAEASGLHILSNTGYYGAAEDKFVPAHAFRESAEQLSDRWIREWERGIDDTGIKPAFMKIGVDSGPLSEIDAKLVRAAALTHRATGLPIASLQATGSPPAKSSITRTRRRARLLLHLGARPVRTRRHLSHRRRKTRRLGGVRWHQRGQCQPPRRPGSSNEDRRVVRARPRFARRRSYRVGEAGGGAFRPYDTLFTRFVPALKAAGFTDLDVRQLLVDHPSKALRRRTAQL